MIISRRRVCSGLLGGTLVTACSFYREPPPVDVGGAAVAKDRTIMTALRASSEHSRLVTALEVTGLDAELDGIGPLTVFAPVDAAFKALGAAPENLRLEENPALLKNVIAGQIVRARLTSEDLLDIFPQLNGRTRVFALNNEVIQAEGPARAPRLLDRKQRTVSVTVRDAIASNGIIHVTDGILLPEKTDG